MCCFSSGTHESVATKVVIGNNNNKKSSSLGRGFFPSLRSPSCKTSSCLSGIEAVAHSLSVSLRFQTAKPEGWDGSCLSSLPAWWSIAEPGKPAQLSAARVVSGLHSLWSCGPVSQQYSLPLCTAIPGKLWLAGFILELISIRLVQDVRRDCFCPACRSGTVWGYRPLCPHPCASCCLHPLLHHLSVIQSPPIFLPACRWHYPFLPHMQEWKYEDAGEGAKELFTVKWSGSARDYWKLSQNQGILQTAGCFAMKMLKSKLADWLITLLLLNALLGRNKWFSHSLLLPLLDVETKS